MRAKIIYSNWEEPINSANVLLKLYNLGGSCVQDANLRFRYVVEGGSRTYRSPYQLLRDVKRDVRRKTREQNT